VDLDMGSQRLVMVVQHLNCYSYNFILKVIKLFVCLFVCIAAKPHVMGTGLTNERTLSAVPSRILINFSRCDITPVANSCNQHFSLEGDITLGGHPSKY
jgi:hypothetical protein